MKGGGDAGRLTPTSPPQNISVRVIARHLWVPSPVINSEIGACLTTYLHLQALSWSGQIDNARHVLDTQFKPTFLELNATL